MNEHLRRLVTKTIVVCTITLLVSTVGWAADEVRHRVTRHPGEPVQTPLRRSGPGLLERNKLRYYRPPIDPRYRTEQQIPPIDLVSFRRLWTDDARARLDTVGMLDGWNGGPLDGTGAATRYELAFLLGKLCEAVNMRFGEVFDITLAGPRHVALPRTGWGDRQVRLAVRAGMMRVEGGAAWWLRPLSRGRWIRLLQSVVERLRGLTPVVELPLRFPPKGAGSGVPVPPDPRFPGLREVYRCGLYDIRTADWDVRGYVLRNEAARAMDRLVFVAWGYREPDRPAAPAGARPVPD